jgi:hypothetical protein
LILAKRLVVKLVVRLVVKPEVIPMRRIVRLSLVVGAVSAALVATPVEAAKHSVACAVKGVAGCSTACSSNTSTVACYARLVNGRCQKACGPVR